MPITTLFQQIQKRLGIAFWQGRSFSMSCWVWCASASSAFISVYDGVNTYSSAFHIGNSQWQYLTITGVINPAATIVQLQLSMQNSVPAYFVGVKLLAIESAGVPGEREVPLVYDSITGTYCAPLSRVNQEERLEGLEVARLTQEDQTFLSKAGFVPGPNTPSTTEV
jgi:hypothetical protein